MSEQHLNLVPVTASSEPAAAVDDRSPAVEATPAPTPAPETPASSTPAATARRRAQPKPVTKESPRIEPAAAGEGAWREWNQPWQTFSHRLPPELVAELEERMWQLRIKETGVTVAAAITQLLDLGDDELLELIERADAAKPRRRAAGRAPRS